MYNVSQIVLLTVKSSEKSNFTEISVPCLGLAAGNFSLYNAESYSHWHTFLTDNLLGYTYGWHASVRECKHRSSITCQSR